MSINTPLAEEVLRSILTHPYEHDQSSWLEIFDFDQAPEVDGGVVLKEEDGERVQSRTVSIKGMLEGSCGTTACVAGWAALHAGWKVRTEIVPRDGWDEMRSFSISPEGSERFEGRAVDFEEQGQQALGLDTRQARELFFETENRYAPVVLYGFIKGIEDPNLLNVAEQLGISYEINPAVVGFTYSHEDLTYEEEDRLAEEVLSAIADLYPPLVKETSS